jgi:hypothetical protein
MKATITFFKIIDRHIMAFLYFLLLFLNCNQSPLKKGIDIDNLSLTYFYADKVTSSSSTIHWGCSTNAEGVLFYGKDNIFEKIEYIPISYTHHRYTIENLSENTLYKYIVFCKNEIYKTSYEQRFTTLKLVSEPLKYPVLPETPNVEGMFLPITVPILATDIPIFSIDHLSIQLLLLVPTLDIPIFTVDSIFNLLSEDILRRSLWVLGGIGNGFISISQIDLFDPVTNVWYPQVTHIPTPRMYSGITSYDGKIYVIGGILGGNTTGISEEYDPITGVWRTLSPMPASIQGGLALAGEDAIYVFGGSATTTTASAIPNVIYKLNPNLGGNGTWSTILPATAIPARIDLSGCSFNGTLFFHLGYESYIFIIFIFS